MIEKGKNFISATCNKTREKLFRMVIKIHPTGMGKLIVERVQVTFRS